MDISKEVAKEIVELCEYIEKRDKELADTMQPLDNELYQKLVTQSRKTARLKEAFLVKLRGNE